MSRRRTERLVNLVICLLSTRRFLTADQIANTVPGYEHDASDPKDHEAFQRMFERDKAELRELGVPLETGTSSVFDAEPGYRIAHRDYALPEIHLDPAEAAAIGLAARLWQNAGLASAASSGLYKLRAGGAEVDAGASFGVEPVIGADPALEPLLAAVRERRAVRFDYRRPADDESTARHVRPWGVVSWRGRWYLVGFDVDRDAPRAFRLSRVAGVPKAVGEPGAFQPPSDVDLFAHVSHGGTFERGPRARIRVRPGAAAGVRRLAESVSHDEASGEDVVTLGYSAPEWLAGRLASYGDAVLVLDPPALRDAVIDRLRHLAGDAASGAAADDAPRDSAPADTPPEGSRA